MSNTDSNIPTLHIEEDFISFNELNEIFPGLKRSEWEAIAKDMGITVQSRFPEDALYNPTQRRLAGFVNLNLDKMERFYNDFQNKNQEQELEQEQEDASEEPLKPKRSRVKTDKRQDENIARAANTDMAISSIADKLGMDLKTLRKLMRDASVKPVTRICSNGKPGATLTKQLRSQLYLSYKCLMDAFENTQDPIQYATYWADELNMNIGTFKKMASGTHVRPIVRRAGKRDYEYYAQSQIEEIILAYEPFSCPENIPTSAEQYAKDNNTSATVILELAKAANIVLSRHLFHNQQAFGLMPAQIIELEKTYKPFIEPEDPLDATISIYGYANVRGTSALRIERKLRLLNIEPKIRSNPNGARKCLSMTAREQLELELQFPELIL